MRNVHELQSVARGALRDCALPIGCFRAVYLAINRKLQSVETFSKGLQAVFVFRFKSCPYLHTNSITYIFTNVNENKV